MPVTLAQVNTQIDTTMAARTPAIPNYDINRGSKRICNAIDNGQGQFQIDLALNKTAFQYAFESLVIWPTATLLEVDALVGDLLDEGLWP